MQGAQSAQRGADVRVENIEKKGGLVLAFAGCTDLHDASGHRGAFICRGAVSSACDTACADQRVPYRKALPELLLEFGRRAHLLLLRAAGPSCYDAHTALL